MPPLPIRVFQPGSRVHDTQQLELLPTPTKSVPLRVALERVADQWSLRLGTRVRVVDAANSGGYRIESETGDGLKASGSHPSTPSIAHGVTA